MTHIKSLFKTVTLFCLSTMLCPGCWFSSTTKKSLVPKRTSKEVLKSDGQKVLECPGQQVLESDAQNDNKKALQNEAGPLLQQQFMSSYSTRFQPTAPAELQNANQEKLKKEFRDASQWNMTQMKEMLAKSGLSEPQIEGLITLYENTSYKLQEKFFKLPSEKLQSLLFSMKRQEDLQKDFVETLIQLTNLLDKPVKSLQEESQIEVKGEPSQPIFQELIKMVEEECKIVQDYIHPEDHMNVQALQMIKSFNIALCQKMEEAMLQCSAEEKKSYQPHLEHWLSLSQSSVKEIKAIRQLIPDSLVGEIQQLRLEIGKKEAALVEEI